MPTHARLLPTVIIFLPFLLAADAVHAQPTNDACPAATPLITGNAVAFTSVAATADGPAQDCNDGATHPDIWFTWTADCTGTAAIDTCGSAYDSVMSVHPAGVCPPVAGGEIACDDFACGGASALFYPCVAGETYLVQVSGWEGETGAGTIRAACFAGGVVNDDCSDATVLASGVPTDLLTAGGAPDGPTTTCNNGASADIWYEWTADCTGSASITTCGSRFETVVSVFTPGTTCPPPLADAIGCSDIGCLGLGAQVSFPCTAGSTYLVQVSGFSGASGSGTILAECFDQAPANDACVDAVALPTSVATPYSTLPATIDGPEGSCVDGLSNDVWFLWTAPSSGTGYLSTCTATTYDSALTVYPSTASCPPTALDEIACADTGCGGTLSEVFFPCVAGETYLVQVGGFSGSAGEGELTAQVVLDSVTDLTCALDPLDLETLTLSWSLPPGGYSNDVTVTISGAATDSLVLPPTATSATFTAPAGTFGAVTACVIGDSSAANSSLPTCCTIILGDPPVANDYCITADPLTTDTQTAFDTTLASAGPVTASCNASPTPDIWFTWTANCTGDAYLRTCGTTSYDSVLTVYDAAICPPSAAGELGCSDTGCGGLLSEVTLPVVAGQTLLVQVSGWDGETGAGTLEVSCTPPVGSGPFFSRGDVNIDGALNLADAISILNFIFPNGTTTVTPTCMVALDGNDDGSVNIADAIHLLGVLFPPSTPAPVIPPPVTCGTDPTDDALTCDDFPICP